MRISDWSSDVCSSDLVLREHADVIFEVVPDLQHCFVGEQRVEAAERVGHGNLVGLFGEHVGAAVAERDIASLARPGRQADPDAVAGDAVEARGLGVDRDDTRRSEETTSELPLLMRISY